jgi:dolichol-phosphate mannosyltransferase
MPSVGSSFAYVIGARNEREQLPALFSRLDARLSAMPGSHVVLVENASTDGTYEVACELAARATHVPFEIRRSRPGLGNAIREGVRGLHAEHAVITACDLPFDFSDLDAFLDRGCPPLAAGAKNHPASSWPAGEVHRTLMSRGFACARAALYGLGGLDTQGSVFIRTALLDRISSSLVSDGYFISTEILVRARRLGAEIFYLPVIASSDPTRPSHVTLRSGLAVFGEMVKVRATLRRDQLPDDRGTRNTA